MGAFQMVMIVWGILITGGVSALYITMCGREKSMKDRMDALQLAEQLQHIIGRVDADLVKRNKSLRDGIDKAITMFEDNPLLMERHWNAVQQLKQL